MKTLVTLLLVAIAAPADKATVTAENLPARPRSIRVVVADGRHNAFTTLARWRDQFWLSFRKGSAHNSNDADVFVLKSPDAATWTEALHLDILPDDRGGQFLVTPKRLFLYDGAMKGSRLTTYVTYTDDGRSWSKPQTVYQEQYIVWRPIEHNGRFYANAHKKAEGKSAGRERESQLITSTDGLHWEKVATVRAGNWESETTFWFGPNERLYAFIRTKYSGLGHIMESTPPYQQWTQRPAGVHLSGHIVETFRGVTYLLSRWMAPSGRETGTMIYTFEAGQLKPYCRLPAGGDCSYCGAVELDAEMLVSYYSSHEGSTNIYLARVPLKK